MFKKIICVVMCVIFVGCTGIFVSAENTVQPYYNYTSSVKALLSETDGKADCIGSVTGYNGTTTKIELTMILQKKTLLWWSEVETWTSTANSYKTSLSKTKAVDSGKYRVKVDAVVYSGSRSENVSCTSSTVEF